MSLRIFTILIRKAKFELDEKRRELARLIEHDNNLARQIEDWQARVENEWQLSADRPDLRAAMYRFADLAAQMIEQLEAERLALVPLIQQAEDAVREAFQEQKRIETAHENRLAELKAEEARKEQNMLDEIAQQRVQHQMQKRMQLERRIQAEKHMQTEKRL